MSDTLPANFDPVWYQSTYPDVALAGMEPADHYRRFGRMLGRLPYADAPTVAKTELTIQSKRPSRPGPIIDRPANFFTDAAKVSHTDTDLNGNLESLATLSAAPLHTPNAAVGLRTYAQLFGLPTPETLPAENATSLLGADLFQSGPLKVESLWMPTSGTLRMRISGALGFIVNAYQATPQFPDRLVSTGKSFTLPSEGPAFWDLNLVHPLMPILLRATDASGIVYETALLAFPSLVPGGLHAAETKALQSTADPVDSFWAQTEALVQERLGGADWAVPSVAQISVSLRGAIGSEPLFSNALLDWLEALFGLYVTPVHEEGMTEGETDLYASLSERTSAHSRSGESIILHLPFEGIPTLAALVSRRIHNGETGTYAAPYLVAEKGNSRPRWMVTPARGAIIDPDQPALLCTVPSDDPELAPFSATVPVAILFRPQNPPHHTRLMLPIAPDGLIDERTKPLDSVLIVLTSRDAIRTEGLLRTLTALTRAQIMVRLPDQDTALLKKRINVVLGTRAWEEISSDADIRDLAKAADTQYVLTIDDRVVLYAPQTLKQLAELLNRENDVASASCLLLSERVVKKDSVLQPAAGGLFPSRVSFSAAPFLGFNEPDTFQPLPNNDYAVVANTLSLTLWRREVLADLPRAKGPVPSSISDIELGLDAITAGYRNLCSSKIRAGYLGEYVRRDEIDPVGTQYLRPSLWENIFQKVTVLRELF